MRKLITMGMVKDGERFSLFRPTPQYDLNFFFEKTNGKCYEARPRGDMPKRKAMIARTDLVLLKDSA